MTSGRDHARRMTAWWKPLALLCGLGLLLTAGWTPITARADEPAALVSVSLTDFTPAAPKRTDTITVAGTVTNTSDRPVYDLQVFFWSDPVRTITDPEAFESALSSFSDEPLGARVTDSSGNPPDPSQNLLATGVPLAPGKSLRFSFVTPVSELRLPSTDGVYLMGVQVRGNDTGAGDHVTIGRARLAVPVADQEPANRIRVASIVILSHTPSMISRSAKRFANDELAGEIAEGGRLDKLLSAAEQADNSYAIDPSLIEELQAMKAGYEVVGTDGTTTPGSGAQSATSWLNRFAQLEPSQDGYRLPYAMIDLAALAHGGDDRLITRSEVAAKRVESVSSLPLLVMPAGGFADAATIQQAQALRPAAILLSDTTVGNHGPLLATDGAPIVSFTAAAFVGGPGPDPRTDPVHLRAGMLASSWIQASNATPGSTLGRVRLVTTPAEAAGELDADGAPWIQRTSLSGLLSATPASWTQKYRYPDRARDAELSPSLLSHVRNLTRSYQAYADLLVAPDQAVIEGDAAQARAASSWWRGNEGSDRSFVGLQRGQVDAVLKGNQIVLSASERIILSGSSGTFSFPVTVTNRLDAAIRVRVTFRSTNSDRLEVPPVPAPPEKTLIVPANDNISVDVPAEPASNGTVPVTGQITTASGTAIGKSRQIDITATQLGAAGIGIAVAAGVVLVGATAFRIRQVRRERGATTDE